MLARYSLFSRLSALTTRNIRVNSRNYHNQKSDQYYHIDRLIFEASKEALKVDQIYELEGIIERYPDHEATEGAYNRLLSIMCSGRSSAPFIDGRYADLIRRKEAYLERRKSGNKLNGQNATNNVK